jgi:hypothetical protein
MKLNVSAAVEVNASKPIPGSEVVRLTKPLAGKKASIDIDGSSLCADVINAAKTAFGVDPSATFADVYLKHGARSLDKSKNLNDNSIVNNTTLTICFKYTF